MLWISLVVLWLFVLVPMLISKRDAVRRTSDVALATRVLNGGEGARLIKRSGPAAGHRSDPDWQPEEEPADDELADAERNEHAEADIDIDDDDAGDEERTRPVVMKMTVDEHTEPDYLDVDVIEDSAALPAGVAASAAEPEVAAVDEEDPTEAGSDDLGQHDDEYEYVEDSSGLEPEEEAQDEDEGAWANVAPRSRRRRFDTKTAAAVTARKYAFRKRVLMVMARHPGRIGHGGVRGVPDGVVALRQRDRRDRALPGLPAAADPHRGEGAAPQDAADGAGAARRGERVRPRIRPGAVAAAAARRGGAGDRRRGPDLRAPGRRDADAALRLVAGPAAGRRSVTLAVRRLGPRLVAC